MLIQAPEQSWPWEGASGPSSSKGENFQKASAHRMIALLSREHHLVIVCLPHASKHTHTLTHSGGGSRVWFLVSPEEQTCVPVGREALLRPSQERVVCLWKAALRCVCFHTGSLVFTHRSGNRGTERDMWSAHTSSSFSPFSHASRASKSYRSALFGKTFFLLTSLETDSSSLCRNHYMRRESAELLCSVWLFSPNLRLAERRDWCSCVSGLRFDSKG